MKLFLSIDIGTSSTKLTLFDAAGTPLAACSDAYAVEYPQPEWAEQDAEVWWRAVCRLGPQIMQAAASLSPGAKLAGISVSGQAPVCVPVDAGGIPLRPAILWLDRRATAQVRWLQAHIGEETCRAVSVNRLDSYFGGVKWLWYRQTEPERFARTWKILQANGFVILRLTGQAVIDPAQAGLCSPCFHYDRGDWDEAVCSAMGLPVDKLPEVHPAAAVIGEVTRQAAEATGLPAGTPVVCGGGDFACACLGAGSAGRHTAAMMLGTAGNLFFPGVENRDPRLLHTRHLTGEPLPFGGVLAGGNLTWFAGLWDGGGPDFFARLDEEAAHVTPGSDGLVFLPYLMGERTPVWDPEARGVFAGLTSRHGRAHLYRAVLEGVAFAFRQIAEISGAALEAVTALDGGARSPLWRQILADVLGVPVRAGSGGTASGSAFLAALGAGEVASFAQIADWAGTGQPSLPDAAACRIYAQVYPVYAGLYAKLKDDFAALGRVERDSRVTPAP